MQEKLENAIGLKNPIVAKIFRNLDMWLWMQKTMKEHWHQKEIKPILRTTQMGSKIQFFQRFSEIQICDSECKSTLFSSDGLIYHFMTQSELRQHPKL